MILPVSDPNPNSGRHGRHFSEGFFKPGFAFLQGSGINNAFAFVIGSFAFGDVCYYAQAYSGLPELSLPACATTVVDVLDDTVWQENSMLDIQVHAVLRGAISDLLQAVPVVGVNSVENQIERRIGFSCET